MIDFVVSIGLEVRFASLCHNTVLPGVEARFGALHIDLARLGRPGDILHEAGHLAVSDPAQRSLAEHVSDDPGEEMAAMAWSYAAALRLGIDPRIVFHDAGYRGGGASILEAYRHGGQIGAPLLAYWGMTVLPTRKAAKVVDPYPHMIRWLR
jgi:hypothetical protein